MFRYSQSFNCIGVKNKDVRIDSPKILYILDSEKNVASTGGERLENQMGEQ